MNGPSENHTSLDNRIDTGCPAALDRLGSNVASALLRAFWRRMPARLVRARAANERQELQEFIFAAQDGL